MNKPTGTDLLRYVKNLLAEPDSFFQERAVDNSLQWPLLVVLVTAISHTITTPIVGAILWNTTSGAASRIALVVYFVRVLSGFLWFFLEWFIYSIVFQTIASMFGGQGEFRDLFYLVGWGFVPSVFAGLLVAFAIFSAIINLPSPENLQQFSSFTRQIQLNYFVRTSRLFGEFFTLWSGFLWAFAVKNVHDINFRAAAITVAIPIAVSFVYSVYQYFFPGFGL